MKKITLLLTGTLVVGSVFSQVSTRRIFIANGGVFETSLPYSDYATVGYYDVLNDFYTIFDTIYTQSVQDVNMYEYIGFPDDQLYVAAQDSLIVYDISSGNYQRIEALEFPNVKFFKNTGNYAVAGKWFGTDDAVRVYDPFNFNLLYSLPDSIVSETVYDAVEWGDSLYVSFNTPGTVDLCPPFGCYTDSLGHIGVIDMNTGTYVRTIDLDETAAGIRHMYMNAQNMSLSCVESGHILSYNVLSQDIDTLYTGISHSYRVDGDRFYMNQIGFTGIMSGSVETFDLANNGFYFPANASSYPTSAVRDSWNGVLYYAESDYATYGMLYVNDGVSIDSVNIGIAPDAMDIQYAVTWSVDESVEDVARIYPNPSNGHINIEGENLKSYIICGLAGQFIQNGLLLNGSNTINVDLPSGVYFINIQSQRGYVTKKLIIQ